MTRKQATELDAFVGQRVLAHRKRLGLSQADLGKQLGLTFQQVQKYEKGTNRIGASRLFEMARIFNVPIQNLYPDDTQASEPSSRAMAEKEVSEFAESAEGWRLCQAFLKIKNPEVRKRVLAFVEQIVEG